MLNYTEQGHDGHKIKDAACFWDTGGRAGKKYLGTDTKVMANVLVLRLGDWFLGVRYRFYIPKMYILSCIKYFII